MRPVLIPGNIVSAQLRARNHIQLPQASLELVHSRAPVLGEPLPAAAVEWCAALVSATLPEQQPYPALYNTISAFLDVVEAAPSASGWAASLVRLELLLVAELGYERAQPNLPETILRGGDVSWTDVVCGLENSGRLLERELLAGQPATLADARGRLIERLKRAAT